MNIYKKFFLILNFIFVAIVLSSLGFAACKAQPEFIKVKSGIYDLGENDLNSLVFVKSSLSSNPLLVEFVFENTDLTCYGADDVTFQLIPNSDYISGVMNVDILDDGKERTVFSFSFSPAYSIINSLNSNYKVSGTIGGFSEFNGGITFIVDDTKPNIIISGISSSVLVKSGDDIVFDFDVSDLGSDIAELTILGGQTFIYDYIENSNSENFPTNYTDNPSSSTLYTVRVTDKLGNFETKTIDVKVDSNAPEIVEIRKIYDYTSNVRRVRFSVVLEDVSFESNLNPIVTADFSNIDTSQTNVLGVCSKDTIKNNQYICIFRDVEITELTTTANVPLFFNISDYVGNTNDVTRTEEIFIDTSNPEIREFNVYNNLGIKNKVSINDKNITVKLLANDKSLIKPHLILEDFGEIQFAPTKECVSDFTSGELSCVWSLGDTIDAFSGFNDLESAVFKVVVIDNYGNSAEKNVTIFFDSDAPQLSKDIEIRKNTDIKTGVLQSKEVVDFRVTVTDKNMISESGEHFVYGDFSNVNFGDEFSKLKGKCYDVGEETVCDFLGIELNNGYYKKNVSFSFSDIMGNKNRFEFEVEVFAISDEISISFDINNLYILNPISRERMLEESVTIWFEGLIETKEEGIEIINYQMIGCNETDLEPFSLIPGEDRLYPQPNVYYTEQGDEEFAIKIKLKNHPAISDLNKNVVGCKMSILKRDSEYVYPVELVDFMVEIDFFNSERGGITQAIAEDLISDIEDADSLGKTFDTIYDIYKSLDSICTTIGSATGVMSGVSSAWSAVSVILHATGAAPVAYSTDATIFGAYGVLSTLNSGPIKTFCDYITCNYGGLISGFGGETGLGTALDDMNNMVSQVCIFDMGLGETSDSSGGES